MRKLTGFWDKLIFVMSVCLIIFQIYTIAFGVFQDIIQRTIHMTFVLFMVFILKPISKKKGPKDRVPFYDVILALLAVVCCLFITIKSNELLWDSLVWYGTYDKVLAIVMVLLGLEASRRIVGWTFPVMAAILFFYTFFGELFPGIWGHKNFSFDVVFQTLYHTTNGVWGQMVGMSSVMLALFAIFGSVLGYTGGSQTFINIGQKLIGKSTGGQGKVTLIASGLFGMISGNSVSNVIATGTFTIPMMKDAKYSNEWAGAVASVGAAGGAIMPPMMGAGAFIMAQYLGIPYLSIAKAAIIPAVLYYLGAIAAIHFVSKRDGIKGTGGEIKISISDLIIILVPLTVFIYFLVIGFPVANSAFYSTIAGLLIYIIVKFIILDKGKKIFSNTVEMSAKVCRSSAYSIVDMAGLLAGAQVIISLISITGFAVKLSNVIVSVGGQSLFLCLVLAMIVCIILGMGLPVTAAYVLGGSILAPALISLGIQPLIAHMFVFYFCCFGVLTPPVCAAVFVAANIAESDWVRTGWLSTFIALPGFIVPYTFIYNQSLLLIGATASIVISLATAILGVVAIGMGVAAYARKRLNFVERAIFVAAGVMLVIPNYIWSAIGLVIFVLAYADAFGFAKKLVFGNR